jgi:polyphosphate glucokinase
MPSTDETTTDDATTDDSGSGTAHDHPYTLAIDIGGTGLKANVLDAVGGVVADRVRTPTTYPMPPDRMVEKLKGLADKLPGFDRISAGFPGMVRLGHVLTAPHFVCKAGPGSDLDPKLLKDWTDFDMASALSEAIGKPARVANDADVQGLASISGKGFEAVITLGTGFGSAFFMAGRLLPHMEFAQIEFRHGETFNAQLGEPTRKDIGDKRWNKRVQKAISYLDVLTHFDHLYVGGGNGARVNRRDLGDVLERITVVDNSAGILGGIKIWEDHHLSV